MKTPRIITLAVLVLFVAACGESQPDIGFMPPDTSMTDPDNPSKKFYPDFAKLEHEMPLTIDERFALTPENLQTFSQEEVDQIYARLTAGPIPDGPYRGDLFFAKGENLKSRMDEIIGGIGGRVADTKIKTLEAVGRRLWKGKMFYRDQRVLRNFIEDLNTLEGLIDDPDALMTAEVPRRTILRYVDPLTTVRLMFPAKLYCGQSLLDGRREAIIIDYAYADEIEGYQERPDSLAGRKGLKVRDEIRMIRPGFYLGRAYLNKIFLLNFTMYNAEVAAAGETAFRAGNPPPEDCWIGEQRIMALQ
ncbi:MAG: hypothetical protein ACE363_09330 [Alphaproteobacteria bacterium]